MRTVQSINLIAVDERVRRGRPYILDTSVTVSDVAIVKIYPDRTRTESLHGMG